MMMLLAVNFSFAHNWEINPSDYELQMTMTGVLSINNEFSQSDDYFIGAFVGDVCRGFASSINVFDDQMFFLTLYSNDPGEDISFRVFTDAEYNIEQSEQFIPFGSLGIPNDPYIWNAYIGYDFAPQIMDIPNQTIEFGTSFNSINLNQFITLEDEDPYQFLLSDSEIFDLEINSDNILNIDILSDEWIGSEEIEIVIQDISESELSDTSTFFISILSINHPPIIYDIPDQSIGIGGVFEEIDLSLYIADEDGDLFGWTYQIIMEEADQIYPEWDINPSDFELSMNLTAIVSANGLEAEGDQHIIAAFSDNEIRGIAHGLYALDRWLYFITIYANENEEDISFRFFDNNSSTLFPISETIIFEANASLGIPAIPYVLSAGFITIDIENNIASLGIIDHEWHGSQLIQFTAIEQNTLDSYLLTDLVNLTIMPDHQPIILDIPDQTIESGDNFLEIDLSQHVEELDGDEIEWSVIGNESLDIQIIDQVLSINYNDWIGSEDITFTVTDQTENGFYSSEIVTFTVLSLDNPPTLNQFNNQMVGFNDNFDEINLNEYLNEVDNDDIEWSYTFISDITDEQPLLTINPSDFELSMTITAIIEALGVDTQGPDHVLYAFSGPELRGIATPILALNEWVYFLTVYSNINGDELEFKLYDNLSSRILPINYSLNFTANNSIGSPQNLLELQAGQILVDINEEMMDFTIVDPLWAGEEIIEIRATDIGTLNNYFSESQITLTVLPDHIPILSDIPDQIIEINGAFTPIELNNYLTELDGDSIIWTFQSDENLNIIENSGNIMITSNDLNWIGNAIVTFTATDNTINALSASQDVLFTILPLDNPPHLLNIPSVATTIGIPFESLDLSDYILEYDGNQITLDYDFPISQNPVLDPAWILNPNDFELTMTMTAIIKIGSNQITGSNHTLAAFSGNELRGLSEAIEFNGNWLYFLSIYSNENNQPINFKFFNSDKLEIYPTNINIEFIANSSLGTPASPISINSGYVSIEFEEYTANITNNDMSWKGQTDLYLIATDLGTLNQYSDSILVSIGVYDINHKLNSGNNLISIPGNLLNSNTIDLLDNLMNQGNQINFLIGQGQGLFNFNNSWSGNLSNISPYSGYWINIEDEFDWNINYFENSINSCESYGLLDDGNNLISFKWGEGSSNTLDALGGEEFATDNFNFIIGEGRGLFNTSEGWSGNLYNLGQAKGYWVNIKDCIEYSYNECESNSRNCFWDYENNSCEHEGTDFRWGGLQCEEPINTSLSKIESNIALEYQINQSTEQAFYLIKEIIIENIDLTREDVILAYYGEVLVGSTNYNFDQTLLPVMGRDLSNATEGYLEKGDIPIIKIYDFSHDKLIMLEGNNHGFENLMFEEVELMSSGLLILADEFILESVYPNPFNSITKIDFELPENEKLILSIFDIKGNKITELINGKISKGKHSIKWNANNIPTGLYFLKIETEKFSQTHKLTLLK